MALDPYYNNVSLLLPMEGVINQTAFIDYSPLPKAVTVYGNTKISTVQGRWGAGSGYFDGSGDYLLFPYTSALVFGTGDFTVECWVYKTQYASVSYDVNKDEVLFGGVGTQTFFFYLENNSGYPRVWNGSTGVGSSIAVSLGAWRHVEWSRASGTLRIFVDGVKGYEGSYSFNHTDTTVTQRVGGNPSGANNRYFVGYMNGFRVTKGVARHTANFVPPERLVYASALILPGNPLRTIAGNCIVSGNGGAQAVIIREATTRLLVATATPNPITGAWTADVPLGDYDITYFAPDCQPICHGPYTVTA